MAERQRADAVRISEARFVELDEGAPATVRWVEPGRVLRVIVAGSGTPGCVPEPLAAATDGTEVEITFRPVQEGIPCTMDYRMHMWDVTWPEPVDVAGPMPVQLLDASGPGSHDDSVLPQAAL